MTRKALSVGELKINDSRCIRCQRCVKICLAGIFYEDNGRICTRNESSCIFCGHCVAVCPTGAVSIPEYEDCKEVKNWTIVPGSDREDHREWTMYNNYTPKDLSPYQAVNRFIVQPALELYLSKQGIDKKTYLENNGGVGALSRLASAIYDFLVKNQVIDFLRDTGEFDKYEEYYQATHDIDDPDYEVKLEKYVLNRKEVKDYIKDYVSNVILDNETRMKRHQYHHHHMDCLILMMLNK